MFVYIFIGARGGDVARQKYGLSNLANVTALMYTCNYSCVCVHTYLSTRIDFVHHLHPHTYTCFCALHFVSCACDYVHEVWRRRISVRIISHSVLSSLCNLFTSSTHSLSLSLHMHVCPHIPFYFRIDVVATYIRKHIHIYIYVCICVYALTYLYAYFHMYTYEHMYIHMNICIYTCMCGARGGAAIFLCVPTDTYICVYTLTLFFMHVHTLYANVNMF